MTGAAVFQPGEGQTLDLGPNRWFTKRGAEGSEVVVGEIELAADGDLPPLHSHKTINEAFYVLEGEVELTDGKQTWRAGPGTAMDIPTGVLHGIKKVLSGKPRMLIIHTPAKPALALLEALSEAFRAGDPQKMGEILSKVDIKLAD